MFGFPYDKLSRFAGNLATCLEAGVEVETSLRNAGRSLAGTNMASALQVSLTRVSRGASLTEALSAIDASLPKFFLPMIQAGEQTGRVDEALRHLERHCRLLVAPTKTLRDAWLFPLVIMLCGTLIQLAAYIIFKPWTATFAFAFRSLTSYAMLAVLAFIAVGSPAKEIVDALKLLLPIVRDVERESAVNHFFHALAMLYSAAGRRVESMVTFSARTVNNELIRRDLLEVGDRLARGDSIPDAFRASRYLLRNELEFIESGDLSGALERSFEKIATDAAEKLGFRLKLFQQIFTRIMASFVILSVTMTLVSLLRMG